MGKERGTAAQAFRVACQELLDWLQDTKVLDSQSLSRYVNRIQSAAESAGLLYPPLRLYREQSQAETEAGTRWQDALCLDVWPWDTTLAAFAITLEIRDWTNHAAPSFHAKEKPQTLRRKLRPTLNAWWYSLNAGLPHPSQAADYQRRIMQAPRLVPGIQQAKLASELRTFFDGFPLPTQDAKEPQPNKEADRQPPQAGLKPPSERAMATYRVWAALGCTQQEIVLHINAATDARGRKQFMPTDQGSVSREIKAVKRWIAAGNVLPPLSELSQSRERTMDPADLEIGARRDHRTQRQRSRRSEDS